MNTELFVFLLVAGFAGFPLVIIGYLIKYKKKYRLIAGYDPQRVKDPEGLGRWVGSGAIFLGIINMFFGSLLLVFPINPLYWVIAFGGIESIVSFGLILGCRRFSR